MSAAAVKPSVGTGLAVFGMKMLNVTVFPEVISSASMPATSSIRPPFGPFSYSSAKAAEDIERATKIASTNLMIVLLSSHDPALSSVSIIPLDLERSCEQRWAARFSAARALQEQ